MIIKKPFNDIAAGGNRTRHLWFFNNSDTYTFVKFKTATFPQTVGKNLSNQFFLIISLTNLKRLFETLMEVIRQTNTEKIEFEKGEGLKVIDF